MTGLGTGKMNGSLKGLDELMFLESTPGHKGNLMMPSPSLVGVYR
jgi:hypothetical protein